MWTVIAKMVFTATPIQIFAHQSPEDFVLTTTTVCLDCVLTMFVLTTMDGHALLAISVNLVAAVQVVDAW